MAGKDMSQQGQSLPERVQRTLSQHGGSWRDYVLLKNAESYSILGVSDDGETAALHIDDPVLANACRQFLVEQNAPTFATFEEFERAFNVRREVKSRSLDR